MPDSLAGGELPEQAAEATQAKAQGSTRITWHPLRTDYGGSFISEAATAVATA